MRIVSATYVSAKTKNKEQERKMTQNAPSSLSNKCPPAVTVEKGNTAKQPKTTKQCTECKVEKSCGGFLKTSGKV
jgi:hypothetical protein